MLILGGLCVALAVSGCSVGGSTTASNSGFTGVKAAVATTLNTFANDASSNNGKDMCASVFDQALLAKISKAGNCQTIITNQLKTIDDFTLKIESIAINGTTAAARVQTVRNRVKVLSTVTLHHDPAGWRLDSAL